MIDRRAQWAIIAVAVGVALSLLQLDVTLLAVIIGITAMGFFVTPLAPLALLLAVAPLRTLIQTEAPGSIPVDVGQLLFAVFVLSWLVHRLSRLTLLPNLNLRRPILLALVLFLMASGLTAFVAVSLHAWLTEWLKWVQVTVMVILILDLCRRDGVFWVGFAIIAAALANGVIGLYEFFGGSGALHLLVEGRYFRAFGTFGQPNPFGGFMGLVAPLAIALLLASVVRIWQRRSSTGGRLPLWAAAAFFAVASSVIVFALYASWSRGAWLAFAASGAAMVIALPRRTLHAILLPSVGVVAIGLIALSGLLPASIAARLSSVTNEITAVSDVRGVDVSPENYANVERLAHWQAAINMATANPWLGVGFGNYDNAYLSYNLLYWDLSLGHAHNYYLNVFGETGMIGLLAYGVLVLTMTARLWRIRRHPDAAVRWLGIGLLGSWVYLTVHSLTDNLYVNNLFLHIGAIIALVAVLDDQLSSVTYD
ncbi:MAG: O-antigen ligase family protein [Chloroflexi bacterium]|nr:O-antigen ligase family protein [Chloroflexota bacterium]